ncbi:FAD binding domain-containing protein [Tepidimonas ignava]|uniref:Cholesterol oxidase n=1 Tax=Tepidimonas ignava TaxID=114249 RepID=A0A4R3LCW0_9BURK|nr:GMC oxidoreductase [Tepidimonas ignava]TCS95306.1 FAD binding domain-containing protein [Tepidimonas ignava]TSE19755.1 Cholesterol oxidase [Tepidimonas ignava]
MSGQPYDTDFVVIGSGFGGSVSALRLAEKGYRVVVLEQGRHWPPHELPHDNWQWRRWLWRPELGWRGFFALRLLRHVVVLHGNAVGGGSITYANTLLVPPDDVWRHGSWAGLDDWARVMPAHYARASQMLGVTTNRRLAAADERLGTMARLAGVGDAWQPTRVAVFFGDDDDLSGGRDYPDPYFGGAGPPRRSCTGCGGCMVGCREGAKNTLDRNYLHLAQRRGATLHAETEVVRILPLPHPDGGAAPDGRHGYAVHALEHRDGRRRARVWRTRAVVCAAGSLGTQALLMAARQRGDLPHHIPEATAFARAAAAATGGVPMASLPQVLFHIPMTAHCLGGAVMAADATQGACDAWQRAFGQRNLWLVDGSVIGANLGVNPSLTIAALAERAMAAVPPPALATWDGVGTPIAAH